jgi:hypothetical protein
VRKKSLEFFKIEEDQGPYSWKSWHANFFTNKLFLYRKCMPLFSRIGPQEWFLDKQIFLDVLWGLNVILILKSKRSEKELSSRVDARKKSLEFFKIEEDQEWFLGIKLFSDVSWDLSVILISNESRLRKTPGYFTALRSTYQERHGLAYMHTYYSAMCTGTHSISHYFNMNS